MEQAYSLRTDAAVSQMQQASLAGRGLRPTHGLVGTPEWWAAVDAGTVPLHTVRGIVRALWLGQHKGGPAEFAMESDDGTVFRSLCYIEPSSAATKYTLGRRVEVDFVDQHHHSPSPGVDEPAKVIVEIRLGETVDWPVTPMGPCYFTLVK